MDKTKELLERFYDLIHKKDSGMNFLAELQELGSKAQAAIDEVYQAEIDMEKQNEMLAYYERGVSA